MIEVDRATTVLVVIGKAANLDTYEENLFVQDGVDLKPFAIEHAYDTTQSADVAILLYRVKSGYPVMSGTVGDVRVTKYWIGVRPYGATVGTSVVYDDSAMQNTGFIPYGDVMSVYAEILS